MINISGVSELDSFIIENSEEQKVLLLYFGASWCGPCKTLKKKLQEKDSVDLMPKLVVAHLDVDDESNAKLCKKYKIESLPTQVFVTLDDTKVRQFAKIEGYDFTRLKMEYDRYVSELCQS